MTTVQQRVVEPEHDPQPTMVTYKRADGQPICGEYAFVTELDWFDSDDEQTVLIEEGWLRVSVATVLAPAGLTAVDGDA